MTNLQPRLRYSFEAYLANERAAVEEKHEYLAGQVYAMTGASFNHNLIVANLARALGNQIATGPCFILTADMRARIEAAEAAKYPDLVALCGEPAFYDEHRDVLTNPILIGEVLSPSTEAYDRGGKFAVYRRLPGLQEYVLIARDRYSVEVFTRQDQARWLLRAYTDPADRVPFESLQCTVSLAEIYARVRFDEPPDALPAPDRG